MSCSLHLAGNPQCDQEVIIGGFNKTVAMVKITVPTCFTCLDHKGNPALTPVAFYINGVTNEISTKVNMIQIKNKLFVTTNLISLPMLMDGRINDIECTDGSYTLFTRTVSTLSKDFIGLGLSLKKCGQIPAILDWPVRNKTRLYS